MNACTCLHVCAFHTTHLEKACSLLLVLVIVNRMFRRLKDKADAKAWPYVKLCGLQGSSNEIERRSLARQYPFTYKRPADDDYMGDHCIAVLLKYVKNHDFHYVWYGHSCLR